MRVFLNTAGVEFVHFFRIVMNWRWRIGFLLQIRICLEPIIAEPSTEVGETGWNFSCTQQLCGLHGFVWAPVWPLSVCSSCHTAPVYLHRHRTTPQTSASSSVHRGGELALVIRAESGWGEQRRAVVLHDFWQARLRTREQSWHEKTTDFLFFSCVERCMWCLRLLNVKACCPMIGPGEASTRTLEAIYN